MTSHKRGTIIDGIGDELVYGFVFCVTTLVPFVYMMQRWNASRNSQAIHPDSQASVHRARDHLPEEDRPHAHNHQGLDSQDGISDNVAYDRENVENTTRNRQNVPNTNNNQNQGRTSHRRHRENPDLTCPICMGNARLAIETNCGHLFCGNCFSLYWQHGNWLGAVRCPVCRQTVTLLLYCFSEEENLESSDEKANVVNQIKAYNRRFSGEPRSLMDYITDLPTLLRHFIGEFFSLSGMIRLFNARIIICLLAAVMYIVSPLDIIPEAVFGLLGLLDDIFVLLLISVYLTIIYRGIVAERAWT